MASAGVLETVREDDFVEYFLFPNISDEDINEEDESILLNTYLTKVNEVIQQYNKEYIWHKDCFNITPRVSSSYKLIREEWNTKELECLPPHLFGVLHYGDNIEDEWFLVFLLLQLTREIDGLIIRVVDSDGEFLLIEAANFLPSWANPETCEKKVYVYKGQLHIIPNDEICDEEENVEISKALEIIRKTPTVTEASTEIQKAIQGRIDGYPGKIKEFLHRSKVYVPLGVAAILNHKPELIAPAVSAFCNRDPVDMKVCRAMKYFPPENRVYSSVVFTKCLYAMLCHSKYNPDRRTGWNLPEANSQQFKSHNLGIRIASGFEILVSQAKPNQDLENDKAWHRYLKSLQDKNYFKGLLEHSQEYNNLLNKAKDYFKEHKLSAHIYPVIGQEILDLLKKLDYNGEDFKQNEENLPEDDDESWLQINPQELEKMLQERYGQNILNVNGSSNPTNLTEKLTEFLDHVSGIEGAEFPGENTEDDSSPPVRPQRGIKRNKEKNKVTFQNTSKNDSDSTGNTKINFDPNTFTCAIQNILDLVIPEDSWDTESGSEMSEYGDESEMELDKMDTNKLQSKMKEYMEEMDRELSKTTIGKSFEKKRVSDNFDDIENFEPVDIDMTALKNILESYQSQMGAAGPASNMLGPMGVHLEPTSSQTPDAK